MNLMFWKKKNPADASDANDDKTEAIAPPPKNTGKPAPENEPETEDEAGNLAVKRIRNKKRMILAAMAGGAALLLTVIGVAVWMLLSTPDKEAEKTAEKDGHPASEAADGGEHQQELQTQLDELKKQNEKLAAELETVKKEHVAEQQNAGESTEGGQETAKNANEITFSGQDPKASAQALKQAIEQMNAEDGKKSR